MDLAPGHSIEEAVELLRAADFRLFCIERRVSTLETQISELREVQRRLNATVLRVETLEQDNAVIKHCFSSTQPGVSLRSEVASLNNVVTQIVDSVNRLEPELQLLLRWRERFTSALQAELQNLGHQLCVVASQLEAFARQRARFAALIRSDDSVRFEALRKIKTLTLLDPAASELGRLLIGEAAILSDPERLQKSFADTFATKSTATLAKRASSFWKFAEFCLMFDFGSPFRASEAAVYAYIQDLQAHGAPTSAKAFLESWNFLSALLGFAKLAGQSPLSGRVRGAAAALAATKKPLVQASPLSVPMIRALERIVVKPPYPHWRVIAGHILFCVGSCSRFSDTIHLKSLELQSAGTVHLLEASSASYKTGTGERKTILLPLLCLGSFVYPTIWAPLWMEARTDAGLGLNPSLPAFSEASQSWLERRMSTGELTMYLREFLVASHIDIPSESRVSSHSMKATFLSWLAKFGGVSLEDRRIAGHHLDPDSRSPLTYSRDELCRLMKIFEDILKAIRSGHFKPDDSRVMRLAVMVQAESGPQLQEKLLEQDPYVSDSEAGDSDISPEDLEARAGGVPLDEGLNARALELNFTEETLAKLAAINVVERTDASEPVRMPLAERTQRLAALQKRLVGIHWTSDIEPSHKLQDLVAQMVSDQSLLWIPWDRLTSRALEITSDKTDQSVSFDSAGNLKLVKRSAEPSCSTIGEYAVKLALQRRSLAFELARICRYEYLESWHDQLLQVHMRTQPSGHQRVSIAQLREADKFLWTRIAEDTRGSLSMRSDGSYPFEVSLAKWKDHTQVQCYLLPLMRSVPPPPAPHVPNSPPSKDGKGGGKDKNQKALKVRKDTPGAEKPSRHLCWKCLEPHPASEDDETGGKRLSAEELADRLLAQPTEPVPEGALLVWGPLLFQDFTCTTIAVFTNLRTQLHQDTANDSRSRNLLYPLSKFSAGDVWIESPQGKVPFEHQGEILWGDSLPVSQGLCYLDAPNRRHATLAWQGERSVLVGYTARGADCMPQETRTFLEDLEFPLPPAGPRPIPKTNPEPVKPPLAVADSCKPLFVEIFAGCARLSKHCQLTLLGTVTYLNIRFLCWPISKKARLAGAPEPVPLRDNDHILGLPNLWRRMIDVRFHNCMKGGRRPKHSRFRCSDSRLSSMAVECDNQHQHDPYLVYQTGRQWRFSTAEEAEYPPQLCQEVSQLLAATAGLPSCLEPPAGPRAVWPQPRGSHKLIPEFLEFRTEAPLDRFGVYRTPTEFIDCALKLSHPFDTQHCVPDAVKRNIFRRLTEGPSAFAEERLRLYNRLNQMEKELRYEEARLHSTLPDHTREVIKGKNLLLWAQLLKETKFPDEGVFDLMIGVDLESPATSTPELLLESARWRRERLKGRDPHEKDPEATWQLWDCTLKDRDDGFLTGPFYDEEEVKKHLGVEEFVCSRRFVIEQGTPERPKLRPIDNYKEGGVNEAYHSLEKLALFDVNWMTAMATYIARVSDGTGALEIVLSTGEILRGELHSSWKAKKPVWQGRTLDLEKAYRQVPLSTESLRLGVVMVTDPNSGKPCYFVAQSLPFGASSSVFAFNRLSRSILHLSWNLIGMISGCFYDDFPLLEIQSSAKLVSESFEHLLRKIGWRYSNDPAKTSPFNESFDLLGIRLNAGDISNGVVVLQNKASRLEKMKDTFIRMALNGEWDLRQIQSLQGQVNFALGFASGRAMKMLQRALGSFIRNPEDRSASEFRTLCEFGIRLIDECKPRVFACRGPEQPVLIFTDAAYEKGVATYGVVVLDPFTSSKLVAGGRIPKTLVEFWKLDSPEQVIAQAEAFAVVLAREAFRNFIHGRRTIYFIDNEGAREVLIKGASKSRTLLLLGSRFFEMENLDQSLTWLERVPSASNVADGPSRGEIAETAKVIGGTIVDLQEKAEILGELCKSTVQIPWKLLK
ncbi:unnamed protein product [Symbiodinium sp. CCMP2592]|nr:unnamed protein product [Symbiodinium sp. CCMP2592]